MPDFVIKGSPDAIAAKSSVLLSRGRDFVSVGDGLSSLSTSGWTGRAADRFRERFEVDPPRWIAAGNGFVRAGNALSAYAGQLRWAQAEATACAAEWERGQQATRSARAAYDADVRAAKAEKAAWEADNGPGTFRLTIEPFHDPGESVRQGALSRFQAAKSALEQAAGEAAVGVRAGAEAAPAARNWLESGLAFLGGVIVGAGEALWGLVELGYSISPLHFVVEMSKLATGELTPEEYAAKQQLTLETVQGLWTALTTDPVGFGKNLGKALLDWDTWADDPARAIGHLVPDAIAAVFTAGGSAAATRGASGLGMVARHADDIVDGAADAGRVVNRLDDLADLRRLDDLGDMGDLRRLEDLDNLGDLRHVDGTPGAGLLDDAGDARRVDLDSLPQWADGKPLDAHTPGRELYPDNYDRYGGLTRQEFMDRHWNPDKGSWNYPDNGGFAGKPEPNTLQVGDQIDRFGKPDGQYTAPSGTPFEQRALPPSSVGSDYTRYEVLKELPDDVVEGLISSAFEQPGGGIQHVFPRDLSWYVAEGYLKRITP